MIDLCPPGPRDPQVMGQAIWSELVGEPLKNRPGGKPLTVAAHDDASAWNADVVALAFGGPLPDASPFLAPGWYVNVPLCGMGFGGGR
jgi:hypothetical protein